MNVAEQNAKQSWKVQTVEAALVILPLETGGSFQKRAKIIRKQLSSCLIANGYLDFWFLPDPSLFVRCHTFLKKLTIRELNLILKVLAVEEVICNAQESLFLKANLDTRENLISLQGKQS